ncbi:MarR family transcriptional regulator [Deinococcus cellulosilyticus]|uniref:Uncharacterized protein n=1 Tax=Deinococcus cellulosilyticus (strain DSM 18568 / NBRC 106333 / KACC 11606 / 5516J-15) TaxID=1223518 RepID=A0A511N682_DEIC1|nr:helix-turn-helix domain-containing protein [Deinococcus cellulosilyticus]GEM48353.1 hypothetical protein DC3_39880 [Deinococcus cellulosilyticus NBRC 106333 = KACC 11606]
MLNASSSVLQIQQGAVLQLLTTHNSLGGHEIRAELGITTSELQTVLAELIAQGLVQTDQLRNSVRYIKREFEHDPHLVHPEWFGQLEAWFAQGGRETVFSLARQLKWKVPDTRATLEEMRKQGLLYGKFVGNMCVYSLRQRGVVRQVSQA